MRYVKYLAELSTGLLGIFLTLTVLLLPGCLSTSSYVDPGYGKTAYSDIQPVAEKLHITLQVRHLKNGEPIKQDAQQARSLVESTLWTTGIFDLTDAPSAASLIVVINNVSEKAAVAKGFGVAASFGAIAARVTDYYSFSIEFTSPAGQQWQSDYEHALHTVVGNKTSLAGVEPTTPALGFATIVEQVVLNAVKDLQNQGLLLAQEIKQ